MSNAAENGRQAKTLVKIAVMHQTTQTPPTTRTFALKALVEKIRRYNIRIDNLTIVIVNDHVTMLHIHNCRDS